MSWFLKTLDGDTHYIGEKETPIECFQCGLCCVRYQPKVSMDEMETISGELKIPLREFIARYAQLTYVGYLLRQTDGGCVFLSWGGKSRASCTVHPFRPKACRDWVPSLARRECRDGLVRLRADGKILLAEELYSAADSREKFARQLGASRVPLKHIASNW